MSKRKELKGMRFGRLVVIDRDYQKEEQIVAEGKRKRIYWFCKCEYF